MKFWHVTSASIAQQILLGGFVHPPLLGGDCHQAERQLAEKMGVAVRPIFLCPRPLPMYGDVYFEVEVDISDRVTVAWGDTGAAGSKVPFLTPEEFPEYKNCRGGEIHLWPGAQYRILRAYSAYDFDKSLVDADIFLEHRNGGLDVLDSRPKQGFYKPVDLPYVRECWDGVPVLFVVREVEGYYAFDEPIP